MYNFGGILILSMREIDSSQFQRTKKGMIKMKYEVNVLETYGTCKNPLFEKMAKKGDITAEKIENMIGEVVEITGYAKTHITANSKDFDMVYYNTDKGMISTGSQVFFESVKDYLEDVNKFRIVEVKTKNGKTYKVSPILESEEA